MSRSSRRRSLLVALLAVLLIAGATGLLLTNRGVEPPAEPDPSGDGEGAATSAHGPADEPVEDAERPEPPPQKPAGSTAGAAEAENEAPPELSPAQQSEELIYQLARMRANEGAAAATMRNVTSAQAQFQATAVCDEDQDGTGEFGTFGELSGAVEVRGSGRVMMPRVLSSAFREVNAGIVERSGYRYQIFLPALGGGWTAEDQAGGMPAGRVDPDRAEVSWRLVAWPIEPGRTGRKAFYVDVHGDVWTSKHDDPAAPPPSGRDVPTDDVTTTDGTRVATDGRRWKKVG